MGLGDFGTSAPAGEPSVRVRERVEAARRIQAARYRETSYTLNAQLEGKDVENFCEPDADAAIFLRRAMEDLGFSGRAYHKVLKVARTIADLEGCAGVGAGHMREAVQYRSLDRKGWC